MCHKSYELFIFNFSQIQITFLKTECSSCFYLPVVFLRPRFESEGVSESVRDFGKRGQHTRHAVGIRNQGGVCARTG
jgi:hypothetical protein